MTGAPLSSRILQVSNYAPPHPGGIEKVSARMFDEMKKRGVAMQWLFSDVPSRPPEPGTIRVKVWNILEERYGLPVFFPAPSAYARLYREISACDLLHLHDGYYLTCIAGMIFAKILRKKVVVTVHVWDLPYPNPLVQFVQKIALKLVVAPTVLAADSIVTINRKITAILEAMDRSPRYIANGVDPFFSRVPAPTPELRARHGLPLDRPIVLFAARYNPKKGLPVVRDIARSLPETCFVLCGSGPESESPDKWQLPNVINLGWTKPDKLKELFACADLFLLPSRGEGFPLTIQEAMSCGLPCAVFAETWDALADQRDSFVILDDFPTPAEAVRAFFAKPRPTGLPGEIAAYAQTNWTIPAMIDSYLDVYRETLKSP